MKPLLSVLVTASFLLVITGCASTEEKEVTQSSNKVETIATVDSLVGKVSRIYKSGSMLTMDHNPERVNIELDEAGKIVKIWKG